VRCARGVGQAAMQGAALHVPYPELSGCGTCPQPLQEQEADRRLLSPETLGGAAPQQSHHHFVGRDAKEQAADAAHQLPPGQQVTPGQALLRQAGAPNAAAMVAGAATVQHGGDVGRPSDQQGPAGLSQHARGL